MREEKVLTQSSLKMPTIKDMPSDKQHPPGFSLVEMLVVIAVMAVLLIIAMPNIVQFSSGFKLGGAAREVATDLQYARLLAVKENRDIRVDFSSNSYQVVRVNGGTVVKSRSFSTDYSNVTLSFTTSSVTFYSRGNSSGNTVYVSIPGRTKNVTVAPTGRVKIQ